MRGCRKAKNAIARIQANAIVLIAVAAVDRPYYYMNIVVPPSQNGSTSSLSLMSKLVPNTHTIPTSTPTPTSTPMPAPTQALTPTLIPTTTPTNTPTTVPTYSLSETMLAGFIEANIIGYFLGGSSGNSIVLEIRRLMNYTIEIKKTPTGTLICILSEVKQDEEKCSKNFGNSDNSIVCIFINV